MNALGRSKTNISKMHKILCKNSCILFNIMGVSAAIFVCSEKICSCYKQKMFQQNGSMVCCECVEIGLDFRFLACIIIPVQALVEAHRPFSICALACSCDCKVINHGSVAVHIQPKDPKCFFFAHCIQDALESDLCVNTSIPACTLHKPAVMART